MASVRHLKPDPKMSTTTPKQYCFVLMPFAPEFDDVNEFGIKGACDDAGVYCERVDEQVFLGSMLDRIYSQISRADLLIADMSGKNPNVFYEVGYAHALRRPVILLTKMATDIPFDLKHFTHIVYGDKIKELRAQLARRIALLMATPDPTKATPLAIELFLRSEPLATGPVVQKYGVNNLPGGSLTAYNGTNVPFLPEDFQVGIIAPAPYRNSGSKAMVTELPDGQFLHMLIDFPPLFPGAYTTVNFSLLSDTPQQAPADFDVTLRVFTSVGSRDFRFGLVRADA